MKKRVLLSFLFLIISTAVCLAQDSSHFKQPIDSSFSTPIYKNQIRNKKRVQWLTAANIAFYSTSLILLNEAWYKDYPKTSFHIFNDSKEWLQLDKIGHTMTSYNIAKESFGLWKWTGLPHNKSAILGGINGMAYLTVIEFLDAHSAEWGWSWSDISANVIGSGLFTAQELVWKEQRVFLKFSFHTVNYKTKELHDRADNLFGQQWYERMLKDYNGQTYWLSANIQSFLPKSKIPKWLNLAVGYGAEGMYGGFDNIGKDQNGTILFNRSDIPRVRQFYIAPDINFSGIKTNKQWLKTAFSLLNTFKFPAPALMLDSKGKMKLHAIYF